MLAKQNIAGLVLAGGEARRFAGQDKGLLHWRDKPMVGHVIERLAPQVSAVTISCNRNHQSYLDILRRTIASSASGRLPEYLPDKLLPNFSGPLAGIYEFLHWLANTSSEVAALEPLPFSHAMICCCDNPTLPTDITRQLGKQLTAAAADAAYPVIDGDSHYLTLLVDVDKGLQALEQLLNQPRQRQTLSIKNWLGKLNITTLDIEDGYGLSNINNAEDLSRLTNKPPRIR